MARAIQRIFYENRLRDAVPVASSTDPDTDYHVLNVRDWRAFTWWKPATLPATITVDCGSPEAADYALIYGEPGTYEIRGSTDNFAVSDVKVDEIVITETGFGVVLFASASYRYWRVKVLDVTGNVEPAVAIASIGVAFEFPKGMPYGFDPIGSKGIGQSNSSEGGWPIGRVLNYEEWQRTLTFPFVEHAWLRSDWVPAWRAHLRSEPFVFSWDFENYPSEIYLVQSEGDFEAPHRDADHADLSFAIRGRVV